MSTQLNYINYPNSAEAVLLDPHPSVGYCAFENFQHTPTHAPYTSCSVKVMVGESGWNTTTKYGTSGSYSGSRSTSHWLLGEHNGSPGESVHTP